MRLSAALRIAFAVLGIAGPAAGQTTSGAITGHVVDGQGLSLPGVTVNAEGPNLQRAASGITSEHGDYVVPLLPPGTYAVTFELGGFERQQKSVSLAPAQTVPLNITMGPAPVVETVNVAGAADVLTRTALVATNFKQGLIATLPTTRDINAVVLRAPSVHPSGPNGGYSFAGAMSFESLYLVNGVTINENVRGQANTLYIEDAIQETTVATDGVSAEYGRFSGGVVNVVTKSGGNVFSGSFRDTLNNDSWRALTPFPGDSTTDEIVPQYEYVFGGPAVKDQLWFFTAGRFQKQTSRRQTVAPLNTPYEFENDTKRYEAKVTYSMNSGHRVEGNFIKVTESQVNDAFGSVMDLASLRTRQLPQDLVTIGYTGILSSQLFVESRFSSRRLRFIGSGARSTDLINGTLLQDRARGNLRYWSPTFCGVCDPEKRDNDDTFVKATYFKSTRRAGSHNMMFGYETFDDKRFNNAHQSGSDYRIIGTTTIIRDGVIYPQWLPGVSTQLWYTPITQGSLGAHFRTHSLFYNDNWRWNGRLSLVLGLRWDGNHGRNSADQLVANDSAFSPRVGVVWDPKGDGVWAVTASLAKYVAALNSTLADATSAAGNPAAFIWMYTGAAINPDPTAATLVTSDAAIQQVFDWFTASGGTALPPAASAVPGVSVRIPDSLRSPHVRAYATGVSRQIGGRGVVRADFSYRDYRDFYSLRIDQTTGIVVDQFGNRLDLAVVENTNALERRYGGMTLSANYHVGERTDVGGNYTLSRLWGNFDGETANSGPVFTDALQYPEYRQTSWYAPKGDLSADQRHRSSLWIIYGVPKATGLTLSLLQAFASGVPYGAVGTVDARSYVANPGYVTPQGGATEVFYYTPRDVFRTEGSRRTDFAATFAHSLDAGGRRLELFVQGHVLNLFNNLDLCGCGADVFGNGGAVMLSRIGQGVLSPGTAGLAKFNPLTTSPVQGVNWNYGSNFGTALNRLAYTSPRTFRVTFGVRF